MNGNDFPGQHPFIPNSPLVGQTPSNHMAPSGSMHVSRSGQPGRTLSTCSMDEQYSYSSAGTTARWNADRPAAIHMANPDPTGIIEPAEGGLKPATALGLAEYNGSTLWRPWRCKFEMLIELRAISNDKRHTALLSLLSPDLLNETLGQLGKDWSTLKYEDLIAYLDKRFDQGKLTMAKRHEYLAQSEQDLGPMQFLRHLRTQSAHCDFDKVTDITDFMVVMTFVKGVKDPNLRYLLPKENELTAKKAEEITGHYVSLRAAHSSMGPIGSSFGGTSNVHFVKRNGGHHRNGRAPENRSKKASRTGHVKTCFGCGGKGHIKDECPTLKHQQEKSKQGGKPAKKVSQNGRQRSKKHAHHIASDDPSPIDGFGFPLHQIRTARKIPDRKLKVHQLRTVARQPPSMIEIRINGQLVRLELDSGAEISILGERDWETIGKPRLLPTGPVTSYGTQVPMMGCTVVRVSLAGLEAEVPLAVARGRSRISLFGRDLIHVLNVDMGPYYKAGMSGMIPPFTLVSETKGVCAGGLRKPRPQLAREQVVSPDLCEQVAVPNTQSSTSSKVRSSHELPAFPKAVRTTSGTDKLKKLLARHAAVFAPGKGKFLLAEAKLVLGEEAKPRLHKPRRVPPALRETVDD
uniref:CCHC-type domain-containing protein n=1 Tax=Panagrellus redivivus TaxID=6233 RepID=A0A7E4W8M7_PANRE